MKHIPTFESFLNEETSIFSDSTDKEITLKSNIELMNGQKAKVLAIPVKSNPKYKKGIIVVSSERGGNIEIDINKDIKNVINEAEKSDTVTLNVTISNIDQETADDFLKMFAFMEYCGVVGTGRTMRAFFDGDGHFRPKINVEGVDFKDVDMGLSDEDKEIDLDLGFGA